MEQKRKDVPANRGKRFNPNWRGRGRGEFVRHRPRRQRSSHSEPSSRSSSVARSDRCGEYNDSSSSDIESSFEIVSQSAQFQSSETEGVVGVFWDIENCAVPRDMSAREIAKKIRHTFYKGRSEETFVAACDIKKQGDQIGMQLNQAQVDILHVDSRQKNAADQALKVRLRRFAEIAKNKKGSCVVLVSSDCDFTPELHDLRYRHNVHVVLIHGPQVRGELLDVANEAIPYRQFVIASDVIPPQPRVKILVENLPRDRSKHEMKTILGATIKNLSAQIGKFTPDGSTCVVTFRDEEGAKGAVSSINGANLLGNILVVTQVDDDRIKEKFANNPLQKSASIESVPEVMDHAVQVLVEHLPSKMKKYDLDQELNKVVGKRSGKVGKFTGNSCTAFFKDVRSAQEAIDELNGWKLCGNILSARFKVLLPVINTKSAPSSKSKAISKETASDLQRKDAPILQRKSFIVYRMKKHRVCAVVAEAGFGKSTFLPLFMSTEIDGRSTVVCSQSRKISAVRHAQSASSLLAGCRVGGEQVAFQIGNMPPTLRPKILYTTDFHLLQECVRNPHLEGFSCVVVDDVQDRTVFGDILLGYLRRLLQRRHDFRVILVSARVDVAAPVFNFFGVNSRETLLDFSGQHLTPFENTWSESRSTQANYIDKAVEKTFQVYADGAGQGHVMTFLTSQSDAYRACQIFNNLLESSKNKNKFSTDHALVLSFHERMSLKDQLKLFSDTPKGVRKIIFTDHTAENSTTVPGVRYVIDSGWIQHGDQTFSPSPIWKVNGDYRLARAGSTSLNGVCYRLYTRNDYEQMSPFPEPEILRSHLGRACLKITELGVENPCLFQLPDEPPKESLFRDLATLVRLGAIVGNSLSALGIAMSELPLEPHLAKMVVKGIEMEVGYEAIVMAAMASVSSAGVDFFTSGRYAQQEKNCGGDYFIFLKLFRDWSEVSKKEDRRNWCHGRGVNSRAMKIANESVDELTHVFRLKKLTMSDRSRWNETSLLLTTVILETFAENLCVYTGHPKVGYAPTDSKRQGDSLFIDPRSLLAEELPHYVVYDTLDTSLFDRKKQLFMMHATVVPEEFLKYAFDKGLVAQESVEKIREKSFVSVTFGPFGQKRLSIFCGKKGANRRSIESRLREDTNCGLLTLDANRDLVTVTATCLERDREKISR